MLPISAVTRFACVIGDPIAHSLSPAMHNAAFRHLGIDAVYLGFAVRREHLRQAVAGLRALEMLGFNVTVPHKERIVHLLDSVSDAALATGAVNTVVQRDGKLHGENTDVIGFRRALAEAGVELKGKRTLLLGAGGAARAVLTALTEAGASSVLIANRTRQRAGQLARKFSKAKLSCATCSLDELNDPQLASTTDLVVNCTSLGLLGEPFVSLDHAKFPEQCVFYDLIPRGHTDFLARAKRAHRPALDGLGMLLHQGAAAFELWTGTPAPIEVMRRALDHGFQGGLRDTTVALRALRLATPRAKKKRSGRAHK